MSAPLVAVFGAGFVGSAVADALRAKDVEVSLLHAPRLDPRQCAGWSAVPDSLVASVAAGLEGASAVVNAAGDPDASSVDEAALDAANGWLPLLLARAAHRAGVPRFVHVSSAVVQGRRPVLDESPATEPFSPYSRSKIAGEQRLAAAGLPGVVIYRPPSVHDAERRVTRMTSRIAGSRLASVMAPGTQPSPQALRANVAAAVTELATCVAQPPTYVIHPWEGLSAGALMEVLGGRRPLLVPRPLGHGVLAALRFVGRWSPVVAANARRVEMLWLGQGQAQSWLSVQGWKPPVGLDGWQELGRQTRGTTVRHTKGREQRG